LIAFTNFNTWPPQNSRNLTTKFAAIPAFLRYNSFACPWRPQRKTDSWLKAVRSAAQFAAMTLRLAPFVIRL
jgi:hypothetical protein